MPVWQLVAIVVSKNVEYKLFEWNYIPYQYFNVSSVCACVRACVRVCVTDVTYTNDPRIREKTVASSYVYIANSTLTAACMRWDDFDGCVRWDALTADGIIMMASNQHFECALLRRLVAV